MPNLNNENERPKILANAHVELVQPEGKKQTLKAKLRLKTK